MPPAYKIVLLGDSFVGKTSLVHRLTSNSFDPNLTNTIGAAFISKEHTFKDRTVKLEIWDTAGQERYKSLTPMYYRNSKVALVCFDVSDVEGSFERAKYWIEQLAILGPQDLSVKLVGNKLDLSDNVDLLLTREFCRDHDLPLLLTSAKLGTGVTELFDKIVEEIDQEFLDRHAEEAARAGEENVLLNVRVAREGCC